MMKKFLKKLAVRNPLTRQPIIAQKGAGLNASAQPKADVPAVRNPLARGR